MSVNAFNPPRGSVASRWLQGHLFFYPGDVPGTCFYVDSNSGAAANDGLTWDTALNTIDAAVNKCTASAGDAIYVHPSHTETLAADSAIDIDVAGVTVYGIRIGNLMPTLSVTAVAGDCKLAAAGVSIHNLSFTGDIDATTGCIEVSGADCAVVNCQYRDVTGQATDVLITVDGADRLLIDGFKSIGAAAAGANSAIAVDGSDDIVIRNFNLYGNFAVGGIDFRTTASNRVHVHSGLIWTENAADIAIVDTITGSSGTIGPDIEIMLQDNAANITTAVTGATFQLFDPVYVCNLVNEKGMLINWTASTHA